MNQDGEYAAFAVLPKVLKQGIEIVDHDNHKGRGVQTVTIAAKVSINGVEGIMAATIKTTNGNNYKMHRILMPDGSAFVFEEKEAEPTPGLGNPLNIGTPPSRIGSADENILHHDDDDVKGSERRSAGS